MEITNKKSVYQDIYVISNLSKFGNAGLKSEIYYKKKLNKKLNKK
jgi:hypothetical protein